MVFAAFDAVLRGPSLRFISYETSLASAPDQCTHAPPSRASAASGVLVAAQPVPRPWPIRAAARSAAEDAVRWALTLTAVVYMIIVAAQARPRTPRTRMHALDGRSATHA